jgi:signal peptidase I
LRTFALQTFFIPSGLMKPTLHIGDRIIVDKLSVELGTIDTGDIVVFKAPPAEHCEGSSTIDLVKRVIGVPGDHLTSEGKTIFVNGRPRHEKWPHWELLGGAIGIVTVPPDQYFVVGDNHATRATAERGVHHRQGGRANLAVHAHRIPLGLHDWSTGTMVARFGSGVSTKPPAVDERRLLRRVTRPMMNLLASTASPRRVQVTCGLRPGRLRAAGIFDCQVHRSRPVAVGLGLWREDRRETQHR